MCKAVQFIPEPPHRRFKQHRHFFLTETSESNSVNKWFLISIWEKPEASLQCEDLQTQHKTARLNQICFMRLLDLTCKMYAGKRKK